MEVETADYLRHRGASFDPRSLHDAGLAALRGYVRAYDGMQARHRGDPVATPEPPKPPVEQGPKLSEAFDTWKLGGRACGGKVPSPNTILEAGHAVQCFTEMHGDMHLGEITKAQARAFRDAMLQSYPAHRRLAAPPPAQAPQAPQAAKLPRPKAATVNKSVQMLASIYKTAEGDGHLDHLPTASNPFSNMKLKLDARQEESRQPFTNADLAALFGTGVFTKGDRPEGGKGEAAFWLPVIAVFTGALYPLLSEIKALAHLTGGGFIVNIPRVLTDDLDAEIQLDSWTPPALWKLIQSEGQIATDEMYRVFNMGIGMVIIVDKAKVEEIQALIHEPTFVIGQLVKGEKQVRLIQ